jgi:integrase
MAKVTARKETGKLVIDFTYRSVRCREQTALADTPQNRKRASAVVQRIKAAIVDGTFAYGDFFPGSALATRFDLSGQVSALTPSIPAVVSATAAAAAEASAPATPTFREFTKVWLAEHQVEWRRSHIKVLLSTVEGHLLPYFGDRPVGNITKPDIFAFRAKLADLPGRAQAKMSNKRINGILAPLRQILNDAAERYGFVSPCATLKPLKVRKTDVDPFTLDEVQSILATARRDYHDYFTTRLLTAMRTGEAHGLKWK